MTVADKRVESDGVVSLVLTDRDGRRLPDWTPGAHVDLLLPNGTARQYSLCGDRWDAYRYRVAVLREPAGRGGSAYVHDRLRVGDQLGLAGPRNNFTVIPRRRYLFVAGGIGITPILTMIDHAERLGAQWSLLYGGRTLASMAFLETFGGLRRQGSRPAPGPARTARPAFLCCPTRPHTAVYTCGPGPLLDAVSVATAAWPAHRVRTERFTPKERARPCGRRRSSVELRRSHRTVTVPPDRSILSVLRRHGVPVLSSCRQGTCGTCETTVLAGVPDHRDSISPTSSEPPSDCMFICVSRSCTTDSSSTSEHCSEPTMTRDRRHRVPEHGRRPVQPPRSCEDPLPFHAVSCARPARWST